MKFDSRKTLSTLLALGCLALSPTLQAAEKFATPEAAQQSLVQAISSSDPQAGLKKILWTSGDPTQDQEQRKAFLDRVAQKSSWAPLGKDRSVLYAGNDHWSFPVPLQRQGKSWAFDIKTGREEILNRRIGGNEIDAIAAAQDYARAQNEYYSQDRNGNGVQEYAQAFLSQPGQKDGLYWDSKDPRDTSPIGPAIGQVTIQDLPDGRRRLVHHGYYFETLSEQSKRGPGGAKKFIQDGKQTQGFGLVAYPVEYGRSGIMTFIVGSNGQVLQQDLGKRTEKEASGMKEFDPSSAWKPAYEVSANRPIIKQ